MPQLAANGLRLVVVGASGWGKSKVASIVKQAGYPFHMITFAGYVPTADLVKLYNTASILCFKQHWRRVWSATAWSNELRLPVVSPHNSAMIELVEEME